MPVEHPRSEKGSMLAWVAVLMFFVVVPLIALVADGTRLYIIRNRVQMATDAACEDAAWSASDRARFRETGQATFISSGEAAAIAQATYIATLVERGQMNYSASIAVQADFGNLRVLCQGQASVPLMLFDYAVPIVAPSASSIRFR